MEPTTSIDTKVTGTVPQVRVHGVNNYNVQPYQCGDNNDSEILKSFLLMNQLDLWVQGIYREEPDHF